VSVVREFREQEYLNGGGAGGGGERGLSLRVSITQDLARDHSILAIGMKKLIKRYCDIDAKEINDVSKAVSKIGET